MRKQQRRFLCPSQLRTSIVRASFIGFRQLGPRQLICFSCFSLVCLSQLGPCQLLCFSQLGPRQLLCVSQLCPR